MILLAIEDITERRQLKSLLEGNEAKYRELVQNANSIILKMDPEGKVTFFNEFAQRFFGYTKEEMLGRSVVGTIVPETGSMGLDLDSMIKDIGINPEKFITNENENMRRNGERVWVAWTNKAIRDGNGKVIEILCIGNDITERRRLEILLSESEERYRRLFETADDGILLLEKSEGNITHANPAVTAMLGYSKEECIGKKLQDIGISHDMGDIQEIMHTLDRSGIIYYDGVPIKTKVGQTFYVDIYLVDRARLVQCNIRDITGRKQAEEALRQAEENFRRSLDDSPLGVRIATTEGETVYANRAILDIYGYDSIEELRITPVKKRYTPESYGEFKIRKEKRQRGEYYPSEYEISIVRKNGEIRHLRVFRKEVLWNSERQFQTVYQDITEHKRAEEALRESQEKYRSIVETTAEWIWEMDLNGRHTFSNPAVTAILGYRPEEIIGQTAVSLLHAEDRSEVETTLVRLMAEKRGWRGWILRWRHKDSSYRFLESNAEPILDSTGHVRGYRGTDRDITERKHTEQEMLSLQEQLRQSQKMEAIGQLAGGIAHDFNNLLTVIKGNSELSLIDLEERDPLRENIEEIKEAADKAEQLTRQLLAFSRKQILEMKVLDLNQVLQRLDKMLRRVLGEDIELKTSLSDFIGKVKVDPGQIEQVMINLAVNARDAMPGGGKLTIETANVELDEEYAHKHIAVKPGRYVMLSMSDNGVGMTPEVRERIFEPFFTTKEKERGTGLGLSTVYGIVKQSGGSIWVYSEPGQGTTFKIYLPQVDEPWEEMKDEVIGEVLQGNETILIVEDEEVVLKLAVRVLKKRGYKVLEAPDGGKAFMLCEAFKEPIHLILTDVVMPGMSGSKLVERLKKIHPEMKVLYMSGYTDNAILHHGVLEPGVNFIQKPFNVDGLSRKVREVLDK